MKRAILNTQKQTCMQSSLLKTSKANSIYQKFIWQWFLLLMSARKQGVRQLLEMRKSAKTGNQSNLVVFIARYLFNFY